MVALPKEVQAAQDAAKVKAEGYAVLVQAMADDAHRDHVRRERRRIIGEIQVWFVLACAGVCAVWCWRHW